MKKIILLITLMAMQVVAHAQSDPVEKIFEKYSGREGYTSVSVTRAMFELFEAIGDDNGKADNEDKDFKDITSKLNSIKILSVDDKNRTNTGDNFYKEMVRDLAVPDYEDLMVINDGGQEIKFITRKKGDKITDLIMIVGGKDACLIALQGDINLKQVSKLSKSMNLKGFEHLNNVGSKSK